MAEAKPADPSRPAEGSPRVVPLGARSGARPAPDGVSWNTFGVAMVLLVLAVAGLLVQTQRVANRGEQIAALNEQVAGLENRLASANTQLATYHTQLGLIRSSVSAVIDQVTNLNALVQENPFAPPASIAAPDAPAESPAEP
jgi:hypothetical protein